MKRTLAWLIPGMVCTMTLAEAQMMMGGRLFGGVQSFGYVMAGSQTIDIKQLNARLNSFGYPSFDETYVAVGGGAQVMLRKLMLGFEGAGLLQPGTNVMGNFRTKLSGFYGEITLGYNLLSSDDLMLYPQVGLGGGGMVLNIVERSSPTFDEILSNPRRSAELSSTGFLVDLGIGARYLFLFREGARRGIAIGFRAGYVSSFSDRRWMLDRVEVPGGPPGSFTGYYVRLMIGAGDLGDTRNGMMSESKASLEQIYKEFHKKLLRFILARVPERAMAEDILHDVILKIHHRIDTLRDSDRLEQWIFQIARNAIIDHYRTGRQNLTIEDAPDIPEEPKEVEPSKRLEPSVREFVEQLPEPYREAIRLVEYEGISQKELARRLGLSFSGAKSRVQRARAMLRDMLMQCCHFEFDRFGTILDYHPISCCCCGTDPSSRVPSDTE